MRPMPELKVEEAEAADLVPYARNAKLHDRAQVATIAASIEEFGFNDPIAVWDNLQGEMEIVEGHGRVLAAKKLGMLRVPIVRLDHLTDEQRRAYTHVHNQTTLNSGFDVELLDQDIDQLDFDWGAFGFEDVEKAVEEAEIAEDEVPVEAPSRCNPGEVWVLGAHRLMCGDATREADVAKLRGVSSPTCS